MSRRRRTRTLAALLALLLGVVAGCGPDPDPEEPLSESTESEGKEDSLQPRSPQWTVLVYGSYDTHEQGGLPSSLGDMKRGLSDTAVVSFLYLEDGPGSGNTRLWKVTRNKAEVVKDFGEEHLGTPATLTGVLQLVKAKFPAPRFFLDLIGHTSSGASAFLPDYTPDPGDWFKQRMMYWQVREAILASGVRPDVLALSGCGTGDLEIAARFSDVADYVVGMQTYNSGYSDVRWARSLSSKPTIDARGLAWRVAQGLFAKAYLQQGQSAAVGVYESARIDAVKTSLASLNAAIKAGKGSAAEVAKARLGSHQIPNPSFSFYIDAADFAEVLAKTTSDATIKERARSFRAALGELLVAGGPSLYADEEKNARAHGVNLIFMRPVAGEARFVDPSDFDEASAWPASEASFYEETGWRATVTAAYPHLK